ncbi:histidine phosphatase family protein [Paraburkholderia dinghuensis]|uniref:Histidine phosphatase family protein n=1 Tax=Paraburkholderia dinghuensis TaxID=2305225 RepID=A0A3N6MDW6_9BURK|nr:histidine phosphatase family protein [Paraburkholderia dinghuensis]RQH02059.1 histidine phosphatase family protein [Paraburkholderia dinghuensis]
MPTRPANTPHALREISLIRHGETAWSLSGQHTGRTDIALTNRGREQALALVPLLGEQPFDAVLSSPMSRAIETCRLAGFGDQMTEMSDLREWDYGIYEGRTTAEIRATEPDWSVWHSPIPEGENLEQVQIRANSVIERLMMMKGRLALFSHAHFLRALAGCWMGGDASLGAHLYLDTASVSVLGFDHEERAIRCWNVRCAATT